MGIHFYLPVHLRPVFENCTIAVITDGGWSLGGVSPWLTLLSPVLPNGILELENQWESGNIEHSVHSVQCHSLSWLSVSLCYGMMGKFDFQNSLSEAADISAFLLLWSYTKKSDWLFICCIFVSDNLKVWYVRPFLQSVSLDAMPLFHGTDDIFRFGSSRLLRSRNSYDLSYLSVLSRQWSCQKAYQPSFCSPVTASHRPLSLSFPSFHTFMWFCKKLLKEHQTAQNHHLSPGFKHLFLLKYTLLSGEWMDLKSKAFTLLQLFHPFHWQLFPSLTMPPPLLSIRSIQAVPDWLWVAWGTFILLITFKDLRTWR